MAWNQEEQIREPSNSVFVFPYLMTQLKKTIVKENYVRPTTF